MKVRPQVYQLKAFIRGVKPGIYEVWKGRLEDGRFRNDDPNKKGWRWRWFFWKLNRILRKYNYIHATVNMDGAICQKFYIYHENFQKITPEMLINIQDYHREIGLAVGIPEFAVEDFIQHRKDEKLLRLKIEKLGLVFTMCDNEKSLGELAEFLKKKGLTEKAVRMF